jgi:hypothetical protein
MASVEMHGCNMLCLVIDANKYAVSYVMFIDFDLGKNITVATRIKIRMFSCC